MLRLVASGVLALPVVLWTISTVPIVMLMAIPPCLLLLVNQRSPETKKGRKRQIVITGGSSGIGLALGKLAIQRDDVVRVVLLARNEKKLQDAAKEVQLGATTKSVESYTLDVTDPNAVDTLVASIMEKTKDDDLSTHVFCCAAANASPNYLSATTPQTFSNLVQTNQLGSMYVSNAFIQRMQHGTVQLCSSMAGQVGIFGYAAYSPTKFALRGYAEAVHMELTHMAPEKNVHIQLCFPPDTDTPGYAAENELKPVETKLVSEAAGLLSAKQVATDMLREAIAVCPKFQVYFTFDGFLLCTLTSGFGPVGSLFDAVCQVSLLPLTRWVALFYLSDWHRMLGNEKKRKTEANQSGGGSVSPSKKRD